MLTIRTLNLEQVTKVYEVHLMNDFPPEERKPLNIITSLMEQELYLCYGLYNEEDMVGYAFFAGCGDHDYMLIDYFAICKDFRSQGYGGSFLKLLKSELSGYQAIIFEVESGKSAANEEELSICQRRLAFYHRNGLKDTNVKVSLFGVDMKVLYLPIQGRPANEVVYQELESIYDVLFGAKLHHEHVITSYENV